MVDKGELNKQPSRRRSVELVVSAVAGVTAAWACHFLPEHWRLPCVFIARLVSTFTGGSP